MESDAVGKLSVNPATLAYLDELQEPGEPDFLAVLIETYLGEAPARLTAIAEGIASRNTVKVARACHLLKGSSSNLGADALADLCRDMEIKAATDQDAAMPGAWTKLQEEFGNVSREFQAILAGRR